VLGYAAAPDSYWESITGWLKHRHGLDVERKELTFVAGVVAGIAFAVNHFSAPGDKIVIQTPVYYPFRQVIEGNNRIVVTNPLLHDEATDNYSMDIDALEAIMERERPRMMILCSPHNPVGILWPADVLRRVAAAAKRVGCVVVSDEIHGDLTLFGQQHIPFASVSDDAAEVSIMLGAPSKTFNIPGMCSSWMLVRNPKLREPFYAWLEANHFTEPPLGAIIATDAAYHHGEAWLDQLIPYIEQNIIAVEEFFARELPQVRPIRPQASFLVWLDCRALGYTQQELVDRLLHRAHVALNDGTMFGSEGDGFMRLNVAMPRKALLAALKALPAALGH
jgi:cystathionine beta-lyase